MSAVAVILAGGSGSRVGATANGAPVNKVYLPLAGRVMVSWSINAFAEAGVARQVLVARAIDLDLARVVLATDVKHEVELVEGGRTRHDSEAAALWHLAPQIDSGEVDLVAIHDGARPMITPGLIRTVLQSARTRGGALPAIAVRDLVNDDGTELQLRQGVRQLVRVQTPQVFQAAPLLAAYRQASLHTFTGTDTASCVQQFSNLPTISVPGDITNIKVTFPADVALAESLLNQR